MRIKLLSFFGFLTFASTFAFASGPDMSLSRKMNYDLLKVLDQYEQSMSLFDDYSRYDYLELFESGNSLVYSDLLEYEPGSMIKVSDYVAQFGKRHDIVSKIFNVSRSDYSYEDGRWVISLFFEKQVQYMDSNNIFFSSNDYYGKNNSMTMKCAYDEENERFYITEISGKNNSGKSHLPSHFKILELVSQDDSNVVFSENVDFNVFNQALINNIKYHGRNEDVIVTEKVKESTDRYDLINLSYKYTKVRAKAHFGYAFNAFKVDAVDSGINSKSSAYEVGADFGIPAHLGPKMTMTVFIGAGYNVSSAKFTNGGAIQYDFWDNPYAETARNYSIPKESAVETVKYKDLVIPLNLTFDYYLIRGLLSLNFSVGGKFYLATGQTENYYSVNNFLAGGVHESIVSDGVNSSFRSSFRDDMFDYSLVGGVGLNVGIIRNILFLSAKVSYEYGLKKIHTSSQNSFFDADEERYPVRYSIPYDKYYTQYSFMDCVSYSRNGIWGDIGLIVKF